MRGRLSLRSSRTMKSLKPTTERMSRPGSCADELRPVFAPRVGNRRGHDLEILGAVGIGKHEEDVAALLQIVLQAGLARRDQPGRGRGLAGVEERYSDVSWSLMAIMTHLRCRGCRRHS